MLPQLKKQRAQIILNDVSCLITLVDDDRVTGVIDFGDLIHAPLVCDLAVLISELIVELPDPIAIAVAGRDQLALWESNRLWVIRSGDS